MTTYWTDKKVLVTGGNGFLGHHVLDALKKNNVKDVFAPKSSEFDLTKETEVLRLFTFYSPDIVIHLAGLVGGILPNKERPAEFFYKNLTMGTFMLDQSYKHGVQKFIAAGAGCGYPEHAAIPLKETSFWEGMPQKESAPYSLAKRLLSIQSEAYFRQYGFVSIIGIPGNVYGPWDNFHLLDSHVIPGLVRKFVEATQKNAPNVEVWGSGKPSRDFVYAGDVAKGLLLAAEKYNKNELVNLSSGVETTIKDVIEKIVKITGFKGQLVWNTERPDGQLRRCFDMSKAQQDLGFNPDFDIESGLVETVEWFKAHQQDPGLRL